MTTHTRDTKLKTVLICFGVAVVALALLIPGVLIYKLAHGASALSCVAVLAAYVASWVVTLLLLARHRERSVLWGILFGLCFYGLLFWSWRL